MPSLRSIQSFTASAVKQPVRRLHITGSKENPSQFLKPVTVPESPKKAQTSTPARTFNTSRALKRPNDTSTIDFAFMPNASALSVGTISTMAMNVPILPGTFRSSAPAVQTKSNPIEDISPEIETVSMSTPGQVAVMSETECAMRDGNEMDVFKMVEQVGRTVKQGIEKEVGVVAQIWTSVLDDIAGKAKAVA